MTDINMQAVMTATRMALTVALAIINEDKEYSCDQIKALAKDMAEEQEYPLCYNDLDIIADTVTSILYTSVSDTTTEVNPDVPGIEDIEMEWAMGIK